jgi:putative membrane protein
MTRRAGVTIGAGVMLQQNGSFDRASDRRAFALIGAVSLVLLGYLIWLLYFRPGSGSPPSWTSSLPALNAALNFTSAVLLLSGFAAIQSGRRELHLRLMLAAFSLAAVFLASYVVYHHYHGDTRFQGEGVVRPVYFFVLMSHILSSIVGLPLVLTTLYLAFTRNFERHRRLARFTFPVWLYVSITGVLVFWLLTRYG